MMMRPEVKPQLLEYTVTTPTLFLPWSRILQPSLHLPVLSVDLKLLTDRGCMESLYQVRREQVGGTGQWAESDR